VSEQDERLQHAVAVIGLAGRFPGAASVEALWDLVAAGREAISFFSVAELAAAGVEARLLADPAYVRARGLIDGSEPAAVDAAFFGLNAREAEIMDPQHRLLLEAAWQALEHAGYDARRYEGPIGIYAGCGVNTYLLANLASRRDLMDAVGLYQAMLGSYPDFLATRVAYKLNLKGPSLAVQTACSTSLVAVHLAAQSLLYGECDMALAGGVRISVPQRAGYLYQAGGIFSPDGHCRPFDAAAQGCVEGDGVGVVVLKRLADALSDGDHVHAVVRGSAVNNDGEIKIGYTAPSLQGQAEVVALALALAGIAPETVGYLEAHGTATPLGDPIELAALCEVFHGTRKTCALGSVKANIGHLDAAAGVAGLINAVLALEHRQLPPSANFVRPHPDLHLDDTPFYVNTALADWPRGRTPRRAGVSSFGIGGTNAHVVLEEAPELPPTSGSRPRQLVLLSAATAPALEAATANLVEHLRAHPDLDLADLAYTLQLGRRAFPHRRMVVADGAADAAAALGALDPKRVLSRTAEGEARRVAFLFPGQGSQHPGMAADLYRHEPTYRAEVDRCSELLRPALGFDLRQALAPAEPGSQAEARLAQTAVAQPALFVVEYALARLWSEWGVLPEAMIGHSVGELVAACLAGVLTLEEALGLVAARGRLMQEAPPGAMLSVPLAESAVRPLLGGGLELAAVNTPSLVAVAGGEEAVAALASRLAARGVACRRLHTSHAFHSASMEPVLGRFRAAFTGLTLRAPQIPFLSNRTGTWIRAEEATDPGYWVAHLRHPVRFSEGLVELFGRPELVLLEVGPGRALASLAGQHPRRPAGQPVLASLPAARQEGREIETILRTLGQLWLAGVEVDWRRFHAHERRRRLALPTYPFERRRFWIEPGEAPLSARRAARTPGRADAAGLLYAPLWKQALPPVRAAGRSAGGGRWLLFLDPAGLGARLAAWLRERQAQVVTVRAGERFEERGEQAFTLRPGAPDDYAALLARLADQDLLPRRIAHLFCLGGGAREEARAPEIELESGFYSLLCLARALAGRRDPEPVEVAVLSTGVQRVTGAEVLHPARAALLGPLLVIPQEIPGASCRSIDLADLPDPGSQQAARLCELLAAELDGAAADPIVAWRGGARWLRGFEPLPPGDADPAFGGLPLRQQGTYLITGGLGGVGLALAELLARAVQARLVLVGRTPLPPRERWREAACAGAPQDRTAAALRRLLALEELGAELLVAAADVTDRAAMARIFTLARERWGALRGVIHAAGVAGGGMIQLRSRAAAAAVLAPKVQGTLALSELLDGEAGTGLDFFVLCSSLNGLLGGPGQADYAGANAFLDAFAHAQAAAGRHRVVAIDWDAWRGVGMSAPPAQETASRAGGRPVPPLAEVLPFDHPLVSHRAAPANGRTAAPHEEVFVSYLETRESWLLSEHRPGGHAVVPGTAYLEMVRAAFRGLAGDAATAVELQDVTFVAPLSVADDERREVRTVLRGNGSGYRFEVGSVGNASQGGGWQQHAVGTVCGTGAPPARFDLQALVGDATGRVMGEEYLEDVRLAGLGPRWESLKQVWVGEGAVVGRLELAPELSADCERFQLHPALLDVATCFAEAHVPRGQGYYMPLSYRRLRVHDRLPSRLWSYARLHNGQQRSTETLAFDVAVLDDDGVERVHVEEFTLKRVDVAAAIRASEGGGQGTMQPGAPAVPAALARSGGEEEEGLETAAAVDAFRRILAGSPLPQVAVSAAPLAELLARARAATPERLTAPVHGGGEGLHPRPDLATVYVAPRHPAELRLAAIWQEILGIEKVGVHDDFFELGGHSLAGTQVVSRVRAELHVELPLARLFEAPTVAELAAVVAAERLRAEPGQVDPGAALPSPAAAAAPPITPVPHEGAAPLSFAQQRLWFLDRLDPGSAAYNMPRGLRLRGTLDRRAVATLAASFGEVVRRHEILRTTFHETDDGPVQGVAAAAGAFPIGLADLSALPAGVCRRESMRLAREAAWRPFDLSRGPLLRALLLRLTPDEHLLSVVMHHIVTDGWSIALFVRETWAVYQALRAGRRSPLPELPIQYADFALWQRRWLAGPVLAEQLAYWRGRLADVPEELDLPLDRPRPAVASFRGGIRTFAFPRELAREVTALGHRRGATPAMTLLAGFQALLTRYSGQEDIAVGIAIAGRNRLEVEGLIGFFVNTLVVRCTVARGLGFGRLLDQVRETALAAYAHQDLPFERLVEELNPVRSLRRHPVFQVMFGFETLPRQELSMPGLELSPLAEEAIDTGTAKFDLTLFAFEEEGRLRGVLEHNAALLDGSTIQRLLRHFENLLGAAAARPDQPLRSLPLLDAAERQQLREWNATASPCDLGVCLTELIEAQAQRTPEAVAVKFAGETLTYRELDQRANRLAHQLQARGVGPEVRVGVFAQRSLALVTGLLAVLKAGGAYVPLDPDHPRERTAFVLDEAGIGVLLADHGLVERLPSHRAAIVLLDTGGAVPAAGALSHPARAAAPENLAYVIYTSGSTGQPKGAMNSHRALVNRLAWMQLAYPLDGADAVLHKTPFGFDVSVWELFWPLTTGARLVVALPGGHQDPDYLAATIEGERITTVHFVPSMLRAFLEPLGPGRCPSLRRVIASGEALPADLAATFFDVLPRVALHNLYGPTEAAIDVTAWPCERGGAGRPVPIGRPIDNLAIHLLDAGARPVPVGVAGELHIGGLGLARGYAGRPDLTAERFLPDPFGARAGARMYRTGDLARHRADGAIEYLGRVDLQVKIRGFRIELGEIEAVLATHPGVRQAVVAARPAAAGDLRLVGYVVPQPDAQPAPRELADHLAAALPAYMVPSSFVLLPALPLNSSGKLDRKALPEPAAATAAAGPGFVAPRTPVEELVCEVWAHALGLPRVGILDDFFALGGHSLLAARTVSRLRRACGVELPLRTLFTRPTPAGLAEAVARAQGDPTAALPPLVRSLRRGPAQPLSYEQLRLWRRRGEGPGSFNSPYGVRLSGPLDTAALERGLSEIFRRHEVLRAAFVEIAGEPAQVVHLPGRLAVPHVDLAALPAGRREEELHRLGAVAARYPFDLARAPLFRATLVRLAAAEHALLLVKHHIVTDGWSEGVLARELAALYRAYRQGEPSPLPEPAIQYADYAAWQRSYLQGAVLDELMGFWQERLRGVRALAIPTDHPRPAVRSARSAVHERMLGEALSGALRELGRRESATLFMTLLAAWKVLLALWSGERDIAVATNIAHRDRAEIEPLIGFFTNLLVLRTELAGDPTFRELLGRVRTTTLAAFAHQDAPWTEIQDRCLPGGLEATGTLFPAGFTFQNFPVEPLALPGLRAELLELSSGAGPRDLYLLADEQGRDLRVLLHYRKDVFGGPTMTALLERFVALLAAVTADPGRRLSELASAGDFG
jgi:amino acid adenylation domain-containing protein